jgi:hypothetical protein
MSMIVMKNAGKLADGVREDEMFALTSCLGIKRDPFLLWVSMLYLLDEVISDVLHQRGKMWMPMTGEHPVAMILSPHENNFRSSERY